MTASGRSNVTPSEAGRSPTATPPPCRPPPPQNQNQNQNQKEQSADMARVLVVDDAAFMRKVVSDALASGGHDVIGEAGNGVEAVDRFRQLKPELTMPDITMP